MFDHLLESSHQEGSNKWSNIWFGEAIRQPVSIKVSFTHLIWNSVFIIIHRYKLHADGINRLQTVRYETIQLSTQPGQQIAQTVADPGASASEINDSTLADPDLHSNRDIKVFDALTDSTSESAGVSVIDGLLIPNNQNESNPRPSGKTKKGKRKQVPEDSVKSKQTKVLGDSSNVEEGFDDEDEEVVKISITLDKDGNCVFQTEDMSAEETEISRPMKEELEENMYNLQMLGEVALQNQT